MVVDTVAALRRATDAAWGWITEHMGLLGSGLARLLSHDQLLGTYDPADSKTLLLWIRRRRRLYNLPLAVVPPMEDLAATMAWIALVVL